MINREEFAKRQAEMTSGWADGVRARHGNPEAYYQVRRNAYLRRWKEGLRLVEDGSRVLDIGGGNLFPQLFELLRRRNLDYWYIDVDETAVRSSADIGSEFGFDHSHFSKGFNDVLEHADETFDVVFSSHCIEHSFALDTTFDEINRVLKPGGILLMAVPFGWELNPEHPYFLDAAQWDALITDAGFDIRLATVGKDYPEQGFDYFVVAEKVSSRIENRIDIDVFRKTSYSFVEVKNSSIITLNGDWKDRGDHFISGPGANFEIKCQNAVDVLPILLRHDWSGVLTLDSGHETMTEDLYSRLNYPQPVIFRANDSSEVIGRATGRNLLSRGAELVLFGAMIR